MAAYLLDTNHVTYIQQLHPQVCARLASLGRDALVLSSVVTVAELLGGAYRLAPGRRQREIIELYQSVMMRMEEILPITPEVAARFARIDADLRKKGKPIPANDVWQAAIALARGAILATNDRHFRHVADLRIEDWTEETR